MDQTRQGSARETASHASRPRAESRPGPRPSYGRVRRDLSSSFTRRVLDTDRARSNPSSPNYAKFWTPEEVTEAFKPSDESVEAVHTWLVDAGIAKSSITHTANKAWLAFFATASQAEQLLHTEYYEHQDTVTGGILPACDQYHLPKHIQKHVDYVTPGVNLLAPVDGPSGHSVELKRSLEARTQRTPGARALISDLAPKPKPPQNASDLSICDKIITPACVAALYQIPKANITPHASNEMGIFEAELQFWAQEDLNLFFTNLTTHIPNGTHPTGKLIDGGVAKTKNLSEAGGESELDFQLSYPIVYPQAITTFNVDDLHYQTWPNEYVIWRLSREPGLISLQHLQVGLQYPARRN